ncbi:MAG: serine/threonine-protein kinase [Gemmatimonadales bacterium]
MTPERWARIEELFAAALDLPEANRERWLAGQPDDPQVLTDVRALLRADATGAGRRISDAIGDAATALRNEVAGQPALGERLGPYRLLRILGEGGMGTVYLAERDDEQYRARVAVKVMRGRLAAPDLARRFRAERQILADLTHPHIAWLLDGGTTPDGTPYLVMEYVDGEPIDAWCARRGAGLPERLRLIRQVVDAVQHAHAALIVHRDLKPSNILVTAEGTPKLVDFGIAKLLDADEADQTATLRFLTPTYAAPEQVRGERITVATDIYGLGGVLYRLLAERPPLDVRGLGAAELERQVGEVDPPPPSVTATGAALAWRRRLTGDLDTIVLTALQKDPARRYASAERLADDLRRHAEGLPVLARPDTLRYRTAKFLRRNRAGVAIAGTAAALTIGFGIYHTVRIADERDRARVEAAKATEVAAFLQEIFTVADPSVSRGESVTARELLDAAAERIDRELADQPLVQASLMQVIANTYSRLGLNPRAEPLLRTAFATQERLLGPDAPATARTRRDLGVWYQDAGRYDEARPELERALAALEAALGANDPEVGETHRVLAYLWQTLAEYDRAEAEFRRAAAIARTSEPLDTVELAASLGQLGRLLRHLDRTSEAEPLLREALTLQRAALGSMHPDVASTARNLGSLARDMGQFAAADSFYLEAIRIRRALFGNDHPDVANALNSRAIMLAEAGRVEEALTVGREYLGTLERLHAGPHPALAVAYANMGSMLAGVGAIVEAESLLMRAMRIQEEALPAGPPDRAFPQIILGEVYLRTDRPASALPLFREALRIRRAGLPVDHRYIADAVGDVGAALAALGRGPEAEPLLVEAHEMLVRTRGRDDARTVEATDRLAAFYEAAGRPDRAAAVRGGGE